MVDKMTRTILAAAAVAALLSTGCAAPMADGDDSVAGTQSATVTVENHNWSDVNVYALVGATQHRLGTVVTSSEESFLLPRALIASSGTVRFRVSLIGSEETHTTAAIQVHVGDHVEFTVKNHLPLSNYMVAASY